MKDFNELIQEKFQDQAFLREYYRQATYFRLADQMILLRKKRGLTQTELAEKAGTTQTVVSRLENVSVRPSLETIVKLAGALDAAVEVRLVPLEELQAEQVGEQALKDAFDLKMDLAGVEDEATALPRKAVMWDQPTSWSLAKNPPLHPVKKTRKMPEFA